MLHIVTGDAVAERLRATRLPGEILIWRDVLHDGPVPSALPRADLSDVRARFIADCGWGDYDDIRADFRERDERLFASRDDPEVVLWFEHDLFDQLQLLQLLDWFAEQPHPWLTLVNVPEYLGLLETDRLAELFERRVPVRSDQLRLGRAGWSAFRAPSPESLLRLASENTEALPFLRAALHRLLEEYPHVGNGLSRNELQILEHTDDNVRPTDVFRAVQSVEDPIYLGDSSFWLYMAGLMQGEQPLLHANGDGPPPAHTSQEFLLAEVRVTDTGREVMTGRSDWLALRPIDRWIGGVHLGGATVWRWDAASQRLTRST